ncbi:MAG: CDP-diacylglycerol--serine O-phosphatidyltransferase [Muribaculaceae bacterium]|nr:CDP-diacylglycerol--serine O-phosphatidyltransferase [Muribaculaceae bacterium]
MSTKFRKSIPNTITCLNLLSGTVACILAFSYDSAIGSLQGYQWAFIAIAAAAVFDFCDGFAARLLHAYSDMGKELDSLSDLVSFGLAPALLMYNTVNYFSASFTPWAATALLIVVLGALRLARFNVDTRQTTSFIGLPIPANAIFWIGFIGWIHTHTYPGHVATAIIIAAVSVLMVSPLPMFSLKFKDFSVRENLRRYVILAAAVLFVATEGVAGLAWTILLYILISALGRKSVAA